MTPRLTKVGEPLIGDPDRPGLGVRDKTAVASRDVVELGRNVHLRTMAAHGARELARSVVVDGGSAVHN
jgi:hypothetical protein